MTSDLIGRRIIVTGAGGGIGRVTSLLLAESGARLTLVDRDESLLDETLRSVREAGGTAVAVSADVSDENDVDHCVSESLRAHHGIDGLFSNAGISGPIGPAAALNLADWDGVVAVNLRGMFLAVRKVLPEMIDARRGAIVCTTSIASTLGMPNTVAYNVTKHAVLGLVRTVAAETAGLGVRINAVAPGPIATRMLDDMAVQFMPGLVHDPREAARRSASAMTPMGRLGEPREIGAVVRFLLSDEASYVTGASFAVDGGATATGANGS
jgi:NAD(P)-dependent dehydrogenase (short-subunit alcohol dehydrogenase family)